MARHEGYTPGPWFRGYKQPITGPTASQWLYMPGWGTNEFEIVVKPDGAMSKCASVIAVIPKSDPNWQAVADLIADAPRLAEREQEALKLAEALLKCQNGFGFIASAELSNELQVAIALALKFKKGVKDGRKDNVSGGSYAPK